MWLFFLKPRLYVSNLILSLSLVLELRTTEAAPNRDDLGKKLSKVKGEPSHCSCDMFSWGLQSGASACAGLLTTTSMLWPQQPEHPHKHRNRGQQLLPSGTPSPGDGDDVHGSGRGQPASQPARLQVATQFSHLSAATPSDFSRPRLHFGAWDDGLGCFC